MGLYKFNNPRFIAAIRKGDKTHTIRPHRTNPDEVGKTAHLYIGERRYAKELIFRAPIISVQEIEITDDGILLDGEKLSGDECDALAQRDTFTSFKVMRRYWRMKGTVLPWCGEIVHWDFHRRRMEK